MAVGDIIVGTPTSVAAGASLDYQPASGVEVMITAVAGGNAANVNIQIYDGSNAAKILEGNTTGVGNLKIGITNTNYLRINNNSGGTLIFSYTGVQTK